MNVGLRAQKTASAGPAEYFDLFSDDGMPARGERPAALLEPRPQPGVQRHTFPSACAAGGGPGAGFPPEDRRAGA